VARLGRPGTQRARFPGGDRALATTSGRHHGQAIRIDSFEVDDCLIFGPPPGSVKACRRILATPCPWTPKTCPALRSARGRLVRFGGRVDDQRLVRSAKTGEGHRYFAAGGTRFLRADLRPASCICAGQSPNLVAEADGNRTRLGAFAPTPILKTGGPTRRPDASASEDSVQTFTERPPALCPLLAAASLASRCPGSRRSR
jgi:hypothetical protein